MTSAAAPLSLFSPILDDDLLTRGLGDAEARAMIEWLVECSEANHARLPAGVCAGEVARLCHRARAISRFVYLWCYQQLHGAACQLAATERFRWPLPAADTDPYEVMNVILEWESVDAGQRLKSLERIGCRMPQGS
ncbi:MAG: hypothetical protein L0Y71_06525 [Gemmataceae bacterium]|nr:hypothetical protein [Gemmataceae bacterium]